MNDKINDINTPTSGAADLPDAMHMAELLENPINVVCQKTAAAVLRHQHSEFERLHALAAGQATAAQAGAPANMRLCYSCGHPADAHPWVNDPRGGKRRGDCPAAPAQPAAQQGAAYAVLPEPYCNAHDDADACYPDMFSEHQMRAFADATHTLRASHGQAPAGATELAEADRRAGAAERKLAASKEDVARIERVRDKMKDQWGVDRRVSFDVVWAEALALKAGTKSDSGVQEDAARYRWLRERSSTMFVNVSINGGGAEIAETLDLAVDAGRKQGARWQSAVRALTLHI